MLRIGACLDEDDRPVLEGRRCASQSGVSVHANVALPARARHKIERLCRYAARPALATERLSQLDDGRLLYKLKRRWRDGTTAMVFEPLELIEKLAALVPPPRSHTLRYHGVLAPRARHRDRITPGAGRILSPERSATPSAPAIGPPACPPIGTSAAAPASRRKDHRTETALYSPRAAQHQPEPAQATARARKRLTWSELMQRVFSIDVLLCPECGAAMRIIAEIHPPDTTRAILDCLALPARAPPLAAPQREPDDAGFALTPS